MNILVIPHITEVDRGRQSDQYSQCLLARLSHIQTMGHVCLCVGVFVSLVGVCLPVIMLEGGGGGGGMWLSGRLRCSAR